MTYQVTIPHGRWMGGIVHHFKTVRDAMKFMDRWNDVEGNEGRSLVWHRSGKRWEGRDS